MSERHAQNRGEYRHSQSYPERGTVPWTKLVNIAQKAMGIKYRLQPNKRQSNNQ
jgi:hypothetical protein